MAEKTMVEALKELNLSKTSREDLPYLELKEMKELNVFQKIMLLRNDDLLKGIKKTGFNKFQGFKYFELVDFLPTVTQLEVIYGLASLFSIGEELATLEVIDVVTGNKVVFTSTIAEANVKGMLDIQQLGSKHTYLKRYLYYNYLNLTENDGVDGLDQDNAKSEVSTPTQHNKILELLDHEDAKIEHTLKSYKVDKLMDLTHAQAVEIITKLEAWKKEASMKQYEILGHKVTFDEETHTYTVDGVEVPSVSTILGETLFKRKYSGVNPEILNAAALWGNQVHVAIEDKNPMLLNETQEQRYNEFWQIIEEEKLDIISQEEIVFYEHNGKIVYIGRYDLSLKNGHGEELGDIKCTYNLDLNYLSWQLNLYRMAKEQMYKKQIKGLKAFWLPKRQKGKIREVAMKENEELLEFIGGL